MPVGLKGCKLTRCCFIGSAHPKSDRNRERLFRTTSALSSYKNIKVKRSVCVRCLLGRLSVKVLQVAKEDSVRNEDAYIRIFER